MSTATAICGQIATCDAAVSNGPMAMPRMRQPPRRFSESDVEARFQTVNLGFSVMTHRKARLIIFGIWFGTMAFILGALFLAVPIRSDLNFTWQDTYSLSTLITSLYVPVLTAFALFWFHPGAQSRDKSLQSDRWIAALSLSTFFQLFMIAGVLGIVFFSAAPGPTAKYGPIENISGLVHLMSIFSPIATAPAAFLLGVEKIEPK